MLQKSAPHPSLILVGKPWNCEATGRRSFNKPKPWPNTAVENRGWLVVTGHERNPLDLWGNLGVAFVVHETEQFVVKVDDGGNDGQ